ncbi:MAG: hypothetical protein V4653_14355 [Pseudomonadota bacterium]
MACAPSFCTLHRSVRVTSVAELIELDRVRPDSATLLGSDGHAGTPQPALDRVADIVLRFPRWEETRAAVSNAGFLPIAGRRRLHRAQGRRYRPLGKVIRTRDIRLS